MTVLHRLFSSCGQQELLLCSCRARASHCGGFFCSEAWAFQLLWCMGLVTQKHVESSLTGNRTHVHYISRQILYHWATRETHFAHLTLSQICFIICVWSSFLPPTGPKLLKLKNPESNCCLSPFILLQDNELKDDAAGIGVRGGDGVNSNEQEWK